MMEEKFFKMLFFSLLFFTMLIANQVFACSMCGRAPLPCYQSTCVIPAYERFCFHANYRYNYRGSGEEKEYEWVPDPWDP